MQALVRRIHDVKVSRLRDGEGIGLGTLRGRIRSSAIRID